MIHVGLKHHFSESGFFDSSFFVFICGCLLGALFFVCIFGTKILDFTYTDWLMVSAFGTDLPQHYLGWEVFRHSQWHFPLGLMDGIVYPFRISIVYTDSIPLFALFFKLWSPWLPAKFQYFGLFGIICYILQGGFGALVIRRVGGNTVQSIIGSLFFVFSTTMMFRIYYHTALAAHFILLLCILAYLQSGYGLKKQMISWSGLLVLSVFIHLYFSPMVMVFMFFRQLQECVLSKKILGPCIVFAVSTLAMLGAMFIIGVFYFVGSVNNAGSGGLGYYSANLNAFFNSLGVSSFVRGMPVAANGQYEGFAYLGAGIIIGIVMIVVFYILNFIKNNDKYKNVNMKLTRELPFVLGIVLVLLVFSLSPIITWNQYELMEWPRIEFVDDIWSIFRSTGRMTWPIVYIIIAACIGWIVSRFSVRNSLMVLIVLVLIQGGDLGAWFVAKGNVYKPRVTWQPELSSPVWNDLANDYRHIFLFDDPYVIQPNNILIVRYTYCFLNMAINHGMTLNDAWLSRKNTDLIDGNKKKVFSDLLNGKSSNDTMYVFAIDDIRILWLKEAGLHFYRIDNVIVGLASKRPYLEWYAM